MRPNGPLSASQAEALLEDSVCSVSSLSWGGHESEPVGPHVPPWGNHASAAPGLQGRGRARSGLSLGESFRLAMRRIGFFCSALSLCVDPRPSLPHLSLFSSFTLSFRSCSRLSAKCSQDLIPFLCHSDCCTRCRDTISPDHPCCFFEACSACTCINANHPGNHAHCGRNWDKIDAE